MKRKFIYWTTVIMVGIIISLLWHYLGLSLTIQIG